MDHELIPLTSDLIGQAVQLWETTEHLGLGSSDQVGDLDTFIARNGAFCFATRTGQVLTGTVLAGHDQRRGYIYHLATRGTARREGIATRLLDVSLDALKLANIRKCHAMVFRSNPYAQLFWKRMGWDQRDDLYVFSKHILPCDVQR